MLEPTYFLMPKKHPKNLERYLISLRVEPRKAQNIHSSIVDHDFPENVFLTYLTFTLGDDDILLSILAESHDSAHNFVKNTFGTMEGVNYYSISNQLKTMRLTSVMKWKRHQHKFLSGYDKRHKKEYADYDWTNDFSEYAAMTGAFVHELED
jgi:hypothetical protein